MSSREGTSAVGTPTLRISDQMAELKKEAAEKDSVLIALSGTNGPHYG